MKFTLLSIPHVKNECYPFAFSSFIQPRNPKYKVIKGVSRMKKMPIILSIIFLILVSCKALENEETNSTNDPPENEETTQEDEENQEENDKNQEELKLTVLAENLEIPWAIEKLEDTIYISERVGRITKIENTDIIHQTVNLSKELSEAEEAGFLGLVLDPAFEEKQEAFAYYTYDEEGIKNRIVKIKLEENTWEEKEVLLDNIPGGDFHHGGRMKIGPDDKLYITTGDTLDSNLAQNSNSLAGKILRMNNPNRQPIFQLLRLQLQPPKRPRTRLARR